MSHYQSIDNIFLIAKLLFASGCGQVLNWAEGTDWDAVRPFTYVCIAALCLAMLVFYVFAFTDERDAEYWTTFALAGRWIVCCAAVVMTVVWAAAKGYGAI